MGFSTDTRFDEQSSGAEALWLPAFGAAIFDFDGTLFDSMYLWDTVAESYVRSRGKEPKPTVREEVRALSLLQAAEHLKKEYDLAETPEEIMASIFTATRCSQSRALSRF